MDRSMRLLLTFALGVSALPVHAKFFFDTKMPPLIQAAQEGDYKMVKGLLVGGANPNAQDGPKNSTALMIAAENGYEAIVALLLAYGARVHLKDKKGRTALDYAKKTGRTDIIEMLERHGARVILITLPLLVSMEQILRTKITVDASLLLVKIRKLNKLF